MAPTWDNSTDVIEMLLIPRLEQLAERVTERIGLRVKLIVEGNRGGVWLIDGTFPGARVRASNEKADCTIKMTDKEFLGLANGDLGADYWDSEELNATGHPLEIVRLASLIAKQ